MKSGPLSIAICQYDQCSVSGCLLERIEVLYSQNSSSFVDFSESGQRLIGSENLQCVKVGWNEVVVMDCPSAQPEEFSRSTILRQRLWSEESIQTIP
jgi:hypothetical protein